jgi:hypothetical protein
MTHVLHDHAFLRGVPTLAGARRALLTEMAEVWSRRNMRARLLRGAQQRELLWPVPEGAVMRTAVLTRAVESDREHLRSLRRVLAALEGD